MLRRFIRPALIVAAPILAATCGVAFTPAPAQARVFFGFGFGFPYYAPFYAPYFYRPPVVYYPPAPVYYAPPAAYAAPPSYVAGRTGACNAGSYVCPLRVPLSPGTACSCPANNGGRAYGQSS